MTRIRVDLRDRGYDVAVGPGLLARLAEHLPPGAGRAAVVVQPPVADRYLPAVEEALRGAGVAVEALAVPDGEIAKSLDVLGDLYRRLAAIPLRRHDVVVALGGGVVGDLAGFLAATWNRGVAVVQVPTTLQAQVDAAVGGKTGIDLPEGKNLVGAFHQPHAVVADTDTLATLPPRELTAGLAEVVKYGLIADPSILDLLGTADPRDHLVELVERSVAVKAGVVAADEREAGERAHLNLGHTYGHALEAVTGYTRFLHGEAVAVGLGVALRLSGDPALTERVEELLRGLGLPTRAPRLPRDELWAAMGRDKKARDGVRFVVLEALGRPTVVTPDPADVDAAIAAVEE